VEKELNSRFIPCSPRLKERAISFITAILRFFFCGARAPALQELFLVVLVVVVVDKRFVTVVKGPGRGPVATVTNRCDWENQTVGAEPNTLCRLQTVDRLQTVNLLANPNGPVRAKRGLSLEHWRRRAWQWAAMSSAWNCGRGPESDDWERATRCADDVCDSESTRRAPEFPALNHHHYRRQASSAMAPQRKATR
jgi:hypothetical protein